MYTAGPGPASPGRAPGQGPFSNAKDDYVPLADVAEILAEGFPLERGLQVLKRQPEACALFESPSHLEELALPEDNKKNVLVLKNPSSGGIVYLIGTTHESLISATDVRMLIEAVRPDVVAVELDLDRIAGYAAPSLPESASSDLTKPLEIEGGDCGDMESAIITAQRLDIKVALIDQHYRFQDPDLESIRKRVEARILQGMPESEKKELVELTKEHEKVRDRDPFVWEFLYAACSWVEQLPKQPKRAFFRICSAFLEGRSMPLPADVAEFRSHIFECGESYRARLFRSSAPRAKLAPRDDLMALALWMGELMEQRWPLNLRQIADLVAFGAAVGIAYKRYPHVVLKLGAGALLTFVLLQLALATLTAKWVQFGLYLDEAARLQEVGSTPRT
ncbi:hypothetical protein KFL_000970110 [Klebsormidium nitens]|uniref:TraB family protein n=1 Tax=Klebsormidium nitens TaxID=105231 RepID=A0A0U9HJC6_KLENI|nr:hypothetical protein KFL_000970110 [Klebsormidium nitens]|eukprot:GAQ81987.1 hypothetical protein KFL_000970110 [Klebsormidium nitens]